MKHEQLILEEVIAESHDDLPVWEGIIAGYDDEKNLVIRIEHTDYEYPEYSNCGKTVIPFNEAVRLSSRLGVRATEIPGCLSGRYGDHSNLLRPSEVRAIYREIIQMLDASGISYVSR